MDVNTLDYIIWLLGPILQSLILIQMTRRKMRAEFTFFFTYTMLQVLIVGVNFFVYHVTPDDYFFVYWVGVTLSIMLGFFVIYEVFCYIMRPYPALRDLGAIVFRWAGFVMLLAIGVYAFSTADAGSGPAYQFIINMERAVRLVQCGLLLFVVVSAHQLGLKWNNFVCGITYGFGLFAATDLILYNIRAYTTADFNRSLSVIGAGVYALAVIIWFAYSLMPETASVRNALVYRPAFDRWNQTAGLIMAHNLGGERHSYLSDIEETVDAVLARSASSRVH
jgi:hypothetical protein